MDQASLESVLFDLNLPAVRYFTSLDSTNDEAWRWVELSAPHGALVVADLQTAGRGRFNRRWVTTRGSSLAFSLVFRPPHIAPQLVHLLTGLSALATCNTLRTQYGLQAEIKWPNDILLNSKKVAGVLVEARWDGESLVAAVSGIGINIAPESVDTVNLPAEGLTFPVTCVENACHSPVDRQELLHGILHEIFSWLPRLPTSDFIQVWENNLAYHDQWVELLVTNLDVSSDRESSRRPMQVGKVIGLTPDGSLKLRTQSGELIKAQVGEIKLRPPLAGSP